MRGTGPYAHLPESRFFDQQHKLLHKEAIRLMNMQQAGLEEAAAAGIEPLRVLSDEMTSLLRTIENKLRRQA